MYFDVEFTSVIHIGVIADSITEAQHLAEEVVDDQECLDEFSCNAVAENIAEIDEYEYDCLTLKEEKL